MSARIRLIDTGLGPARWNVATSAAIVELHRAACIPDTWRFYRHERAVLVGADKDYRHEIWAERCRSRKIAIARRYSAGETEYMDPGILAWDIVAGPGCFGIYCTNFAMAVGWGLAAALARVGLPVEFRAPNDIVIAGRIVGHSFHAREETTTVLHGYILVDADLSLRPKVLKEQEFRSSANALANLSEFIGRAPPFVEISGMLVAGLTHAMRWTSEAAALGFEELTLAERLLAGRFGAEPVDEGAKRSSARLRGRRRQEARLP